MKGELAMTIRRQIFIYNMYILMITTLIIFFAVTSVFQVNFAVMRGRGIMADKIISDIFTEIIRNSSIYKYSAIIIVSAIAGIIITAIVTNIMLAKRILKPIDELTAAVYKIKNNDLNFELLGSDIHEVNDLCKAFDDMRIQLKESRMQNEIQIRERKIMLANISHDIKTPLTSIKGYIEAIIDGVASSREKMDKYLGIICRKTAVIEEMINNMSELSMLELEKINMNFEYGNVGEFLRGIADEYNYENKHAKIKCLFSGDAVIINADFSMLRRVFCNLVDNSIKYRRGDVCDIDIDIMEIREGYIISVTDNGIGIKSSDIDNVFDLFYRADPSRTSNIKGNGLGLAIARNIVEQHGGKIWIESEKDKGTSAHILLRKDDFNEENSDN